jgi:hypothetical protein
MPAKQASDPVRTDLTCGYQNPINHTPNPDPEIVPEPVEAVAPEPQIAPEPARRSARGHIPSRRLRESEEYEQRERAAQDAGEAWAEHAEANGNSLAMIVQSPYSFAATSGELWVPQSFKQVMKREKECWELVPLPPDANLTGGRWTYAIKFDAQGNLLKRKARYVAQGYTHECISGSLAVKQLSTKAL